MQDHEREFLEFAIDHGVLRFGEFVLKSGRVSPYFFNSGLFHGGQSLGRLGSYYARAIDAAGTRFDGIFGPAYKGIPLAAAVAIAFANEFDRDVPYAFNRKEAKDHGEGGATVGAPLAGRMLIVDDVVSAGTSVRESIAIIEGAGATPTGIAIALDRQERGIGSRSAVQEIRNAGLEVISVATLAGLIELLEGSPRFSHMVGPLRDYRDAWGETP